MNRNKTNKQTNKQTKKHRKEKKIISNQNKAKQRKGK